MSPGSAAAHLTACLLAQGPANTSPPPPTYTHEDSQLQSLGDLLLAHVVQQTCLDPELRKARAPVAAYGASRLTGITTCSCRALLARSLSKMLCKCTPPAPGAPQLPGCNPPASWLPPQLPQPLPAPRTPPPAPWQALCQLQGPPPAPWLHLPQLPGPPSAPWPQPPNSPASRPPPAP